MKAHDGDDKQSGHLVVGLMASVLVERAKTYHGKNGIDVLYPVDSVSQSVPT